jgi:hypothetical protein
MTQSLREISVLDVNELEGVLEDPLRFTKADSRFFYIKASGSNVALEAMNGKSRKNKTWQRSLQFSIIVLVCPYRVHSISSRPIARS